MRSKTLNQIVEACGHQATIALVREYGGRQLSIPMEPSLTENHHIAMCIGLTNARKLARLRGGERIDIPAVINTLLELRNEAIVAAFDADRSIRSIALEFQISRKWVRHVVTKAGRGERLNAREPEGEGSQLPESALDD